MSCYFRHIKDVLAEAGIEVTPQNKKKVDQAIHSLMDIEYKQCSPTWKKLKERILSDEQEKKEFTARLKQLLEQGS